MSETSSALIRFISYPIIAAALAGMAGWLLAGQLPEGAIAGAIFGGSLGMIAAARRGASGSSAAFEFEGAGLADDQLTTIARRNLTRDAYRDSYLNPEQSHHHRAAAAAGAKSAEITGKQDGRAEARQG